MSIVKIASYVEQAMVGDDPGPWRKVWAAAVVDFGGAGDHRTLDAFADAGRELGDRLTRCALDLIGGKGGEPLAYGKGAIVGARCTIEQAAATLHVQMGAPVRSLIGQGLAIIPSTVKQGGPGTHLDVPLQGADDEWDFSYLDAIEVFVPGAPRPGELVVILALARGGRAYSHVGRPTG